MHNHNHEHTQKVAVLGLPGSGSTSLILRHTHDKYHDYQESTIGGAFISHLIEVQGNITIRQEIWDFSNELIHRHNRYSVRDPVGLGRINMLRGYQTMIVVYDSTSQDSFETAKIIVAESKSYAPAASIVLVQTKGDLANKREVDEEEAQEYALSEGIEIVFTSSRDPSQGRSDCSEPFALAAQHCVSKTPDLKRTQDWGTFKIKNEVSDIIGNYLRRYTDTASNRFFRSPSTSRIQAAKEIQSLISVAETSDDFSKDFLKKIFDIEEDHLASSFWARRGVTKSGLHKQMVAAYDDLVEKGLIADFREDPEFLAETTPLFRRPN